MEFRHNERLIVVHFGELWLKGHNRNKYVRLLEANLREQLRGESFVLQRHFDRLILRLDKKSNTDSIESKLGKVFGISGFDVALATGPTVAQISGTAKKMLAEKPRPASVKINSHRSYKQLPFTSVDVVEKLKDVVDKLGIEPMIKGYERELNVSITKDVAFLSFEKEKGPGGLPVGSSGKAIILLSGGIDSPVAAWYAMKRGLVPVYVHLHAFKDDKEAENGKLASIIGTLSGFYPHYTAYFIPSYVFQANSFKFGKYELILLKAFMLRLAEKLAAKEDAKSIFTGESLGQVASQTSSNLLAEQQGIDLPILRPLIGFDKEEIVNVAKRIGTFEESIKPYKDVCSINARNPKTEAKAEEIKKMLKHIGIDKVVNRTLKLSSVVSA